MCTVPYHSWRNTDRPLGLPAGAFQCGCGTICEDCRHYLSGVAGDFVGSGGTEKAGQAPSSKGRPLPVYVACGLSLAAMVIVLFSSTAAYYVMWALAIIVFGLAVYYTVKQL